jgi:hypothetical protein
VRNASLSVFYASADEIDFYAGDGDDDVDFRGTAVISNTRTNIYGGFGADTITIDSNGADPGGTANDIAALCIVDGGSGSDTLLIHDGGDTTADTMTLTDSQIGAAAGDNFFGAGGNLTYSSIATLTIDMGRPGNVAVVNSTASFTTTTINTGEGSDQIYIDSNGRFAVGGTVNEVKSSFDGQRRRGGQLADRRGQ